MNGFCVLLPYDTAGVQPRAILLFKYVFITFKPFAEGPYSPN